MLNPEYRRRAEQLLALHRGPLLLLPNAWDAMSAKIFEEAGFNAVATTSAGVAWSLGQADGENIPWHDMLAAITRIVGAVKVPVTADIEGGFSSSTADLIYRVEELIRAGASGLNLEDGINHGKSLRPVEEVCERIAAVRRTAVKMDVPLVINGRTDIYLGAGSNDPSLFEGVLARCRAYITAGADCVYPIGLSDLSQVRRLVSELKAPVNIMGRPGAPSVPELQEAGVARVSTATTATLYAAGALADAMGNLIRSGSFERLTSSYNYGRMQKLFAR